MTPRRHGGRLGRVVLAALAAFAGCPATAQSLQVHGMLDLRTVYADARDDRWLDGGLGKARHDARHDGITGAGALVVDWQATPSLLASAEVQYVPDARRPLDLVDAWVRWRPVSTTRWRGSVKAGMFFPPVSLETDAIGWTSPYTLTPSAVNTWVGEELRTFGVEARAEHRGARGTLAASLAVFGKNDPAGELLASRGWAMHDVVSGLDGSLRESDVFAARNGAAAPMRFRPFLETDHRIGAYAALEWRTPSDDRLTLMAYDNRTDPAREVDYAGRELYGWRTKFWNAGAQRHLGEDLVVLAQGMHGSTEIDPVPGLRVDTRFDAGYAMLARTTGRWRPAARIDLFRAKQTPDGGSAALDEHGHAVTVALNWRPQERLRVTGELLRIDSSRNQRRAEGLDPRQVELQVQASVRWFF